MSRGKFESIIDKNMEDRLTDDRPRIEHLREIPMYPVSHPFKARGGLYTGSLTRHSSAIIVYF